MKYIVLSWLFVFPVFVKAQTIRSIFDTGTGVVQNFVIPLLMTVAVAVFLVGVVRFIAASGEVEKRKKAKDFIVWGLIGLVFLVGFWALVVVLINTFFGGGGPPGIPGGWPPQIP